MRIPILIPALLVLIAQPAFALRLSEHAQAAPSDRPAPGSYGFNWLDPAHATCKQLGAKDLSKASKCTASPNAFGLDVESHACKVSARVELIVYKTAAQCQQGLETMQANGD